MGNQRGARISSAGMLGISTQSISPYSASWMRVKTLVAAAPPAARMASRARAMWGESMSSPIIFSAK